MKITIEVNSNDEIRVDKTDCSTDEVQASAALLIGLAASEVYRNGKGTITYRQAFEEVITFIYKKRGIIEYWSNQNDRKENL